MGYALWGAEERQVQNVSGLDAYLTGLDSYYATGGQASVHQTAAVEFPLGLISRAFMMAETTVPVPGLDPLTLSMIARQTIARGNAVFQVDLDLATRILRLLPVAGYEVAGGVAPETWRYTIEQNRPGRDDPVTRNVPAEGMVHVRYGPDPERPWHGISPLVRAGVTAETLAKVEKSLNYEVSPASGLLMPMPDGTEQKQAQQVANAISRGKGAITPIEAIPGFGPTAPTQTKDAYDQKRFGPMVPETSIQLRDGSALAVMAAMGALPAMFQSEGSGLRESYRNLFTGTVEPLGALISAELSEKMGIPFALHFPEIVKSDISARSRAYVSLLQAQVDPEYARRVVGMPPA